MFLGYGDSVKTSSIHNQDQELLTSHAWLRLTILPVVLILLTPITSPGSALLFHGGTDVAVFDSGIFNDPGTGLTFEAWLKPLSLSNDCVVLAREIRTIRCGEYHSRMADSSFSLIHVVLHVGAV